LKQENIIDMVIPTKLDLIEAYDRIKTHIHRTPLLTNSYINKLCDAEIYFKCENFQKGGAYKIRGALNATLQLSEKQLVKGIATHSSGNFAQAVALSANILNTQSYIVMPDNAPTVKKEATMGYGANVILCPPTLQDRESFLKEIVDTHGVTPLHPSNDVPVIIGQGTCAYEIIQDLPEVDYIVTPVGGGGVAAGSILATEYFTDHAKVIGAEPANADDAFRSLTEGRIMPSEAPDTIADGLRTQLGSNNFPIISKYIDRIILVEEEEIISAMLMVWQRMKIIIEPSSATTLAVVLKNKPLFKNKKIGLIITGGNVDLYHLPF